MIDLKALGFGIAISPVLYTLLGFAFYGCFLGTKKLASALQTTRTKRERLSSAQLTSKPTPDPLLVSGVGSSEFCP